MRFGSLLMFCTASVFAAIPFTASLASGTLDVLHTFTNNEGGTFPESPLIRDENGIFYGTASAGGATSGVCFNGCGTVFSLAPPKSAGGKWKYTVLHAFNGKTSDGGFPRGRLFRDKTGALFGTTQTDARHQPADLRLKPGAAGTVFKLAPPASGIGAWTHEIVHGFSNDDGAIPTSGVIADANGVLYGTTSSGGSENGGVVFRLTPPTGGGEWKYEILKTFAMKNGDQPFGGLVLDADGNLYGVSEADGTFSAGSLWRLMPPLPGKKNWQFDVLHQFKGGTMDGEGPSAALLLREGVLYGTTSGGGTNSAGTIFSLRLPKSQSDRGKYALLHSFDPVTEGRDVSSQLVADNKGALYGTALMGGISDKGTIFRLSPPTGSSTTWTEKTLFTFQDSPQPVNPGDGVFRDKNGKLFGVSGGGGIRDKGTVFVVTP